MKIREIWFLLRYEVMRGTWLIPLGYGLFTLEIYDRVREQSKVMFSMNAGGQEQGYLMMLWFAFSAVFSEHPSVESVDAGKRLVGSHELRFLLQPGARSTSLVYGEGRTVHSPGFNAGDFGLLDEPSRSSGQN